MNTDTQKPIVVVGAGIIGLCTALHLRTATDRPVVVVDAGEIGDGTTPAGAGFVANWSAVLPHLGPSGQAIGRFSLDFYNAIARSGAEIRYRNNGNIVFFNEASSFDASVPAMLGHPQAAPDTRVVTPAEIAALTSDAVDADRIAGGVFLPQGIQLETRLLLEHLAGLVTGAGIELRTRTRVVSLHRHQGRLEGLGLEVGTADGVTSPLALETDCVVLAAGAWLNDLLAHVDWRLPLLPFVATRFVTEDVGLAPTMPTLQGKDFPLWIRESEGGFTWGTTPGGAPAHRIGGAWRSHRPAERSYEQLVADMADDTGRVAEVFPALAGAQVIRTIQGMPVYTVDRQFFLGPVPTCAGLWAVGGDNESGVSHAPGLGRLVADLVTASDRALCDPTPYRLDRFAPDDFADAEAVGQHFVATDGGFLADAMRA